MRFTLNRSKTAIASINRGGLRVLPDAKGIFDTELYRDSISVDTGSLAITDMRYTTTISAEQISSAKAEIEELVNFWVKEGIAILEETPKAKKAE